MKRLVLILFTINCLSQAPAIEWQHIYAGSNDDIAGSVLQTSDSGYIICGYTKSNDGQVSGNHGLYDSWIIRLNNAGNIVWRKTLGAEGNEFATQIKQTSDGGYIVVGYSDSFNDSSLSHGSFDYWIVKISATGTIEWQKNYGGMSDDRAYSVELTDDGGYIVSGHATSYDGDVTYEMPEIKNYWIVKLNASGALQWQKSYGGNGYGEARKIKQTPDGGYIVAGHSYSNTPGNIGDLTNHHGDYDFYALKIDATGHVEWQKVYGGSRSDVAFDTIACSDGGYIMVGFSDSLNGDVTNPIGFKDFWVVKVSHTGNLEWQKRIGGYDDEIAMGIVQTPDGNYVIAGSTVSDSVDVAFNHGGGDVWLVKIDNTGNLLWEKTYGGNRNDDANCISLTSDGGYITAGSSNTYNDGDVLGPNDLLLTYSYWVVKYGPDTLSVGNFEPTILKLGFDESNLILNAALTNNEIINKISVVDIHGKMICQETEKNNQINIGSLSSGIYFLQVSSNIKTYRTKFIKQ